MQPCNFVNRDVVGSLSMKPFAMKSRRGMQLHWWVTAGLAAAFFIFGFDLIPGVRSAATGSVAGSKSSALSDSETILNDDWSGILDEPAGTQTPRARLTSDDPLVHALQSGNEAEPRELSDKEPINDSAELSARSRQRPLRDSEVAAASYDATGLRRQPDSSAGRSSAKIASSGDVIPADVAVQLKNIDEWLRNDRILDAHAQLSGIYWKHRDLRDLIRERIDRTATLIFTTADRQFAEPHFVDYGETLESIAKQYDVPWMYLAMLNHVTPEKLQAGQQLKVVRGPFGGVVDLDEFCLTVHAHGWYVHRYQIGIGRDEKTPTGEFTVQEKLENPAWYNPGGGVVDADDPENPLGEYWIGLGNHIGIHGTIDPDSIGKAASRGCIHLNDEDIIEVFGLLSVKSKVMIRK